MKVYYKNKCLGHKSKETALFINGHIYEEGSVENRRQIQTVIAKSETETVRSYKLESSKFSFKVLGRFWNRDKKLHSTIV